jgi:hypothetical protein
MPNPWLLGAAVLLGAFLLSGVTPRYSRARARVRRVERWAERYRGWVDGGQSAGDDRDWLIGRGPEMQADAKVVGLGVVYVAPPAAVGGGPFQPHFMFSDLAGVTTFGAGTAERLIELTKVEHQVRVLAGIRRRDLVAPWRWVQLAFERLVRFPQYLLRTAGFSDSVAGSAAARGAGLAWSGIVGLATVGAFVLGVADRV